jgi:S-adenosylmethionine:tRNA ribosyltransferase-isomerase
MRTENLNYDLPSELIAQEPAKIRSESRLLVLNRLNGQLTDSRFSQIGEFLLPGDCLVLNNTKVLPARFFARRASGAKLEGLFLVVNTSGEWEVMLKGVRKVKVGEIICLTDKTNKDFCRATLLDKKTDSCLLKVESDFDAESVLEQIGFPPLPPYIKRTGDQKQAAVDKERYQTVYACRPGAVAAPTAGLHFTGELIEQLKTNGVNFVYVTLHVGAGTFKPVTADNLEEHQIHQEWFSIDEKVVQKINAAKEKGSRIIAVGTTSVRSLESAAEGQGLKNIQGMTGLFIKPGYKFKIVDAMVTNFHLPKSTLLALVASFTGLENIMGAYRYAIEQRYRFYSYGDAMLII